MEDFLQEIEEYAQRLKDGKKGDNTEDAEESLQDDSNSEIDNIYQEIEMIKEELEDEKLKVVMLEEAIIKKNKLIETLESKIKKEETGTMQETKKCRYWNRGFCREGKSCKFSHPNEDCKNFLETGKCKERECRQRHRRKCRYYTTEEGCFRKENCQYLHDIITEENNYNSKESNIAQEKVVDFKCDFCSFITTKKIIFNKHMNTKHGDVYRHETVSTFIFRLGLEELAEEYKDYFKRYGYTRSEADHVEKMVSKYGVEYILKPVD